MRRVRVPGLRPVLLAALASPMACTDEFPAGLQTDYDYRATFDPPLADTVVARVRFTNHRGDSIFGTFEDLDPEPGDAEQFGTVFPLAGAIAGAAVTFTLAAPGVRVYHEGTQSDGRIEGACHPSRARSGCGPVDRARSARRTSRGQVALG